jgi:hypothetical protein
VVSVGEEADTKTRQQRTVRLLAPLAAVVEDLQRPTGELLSVNFIYAGR